LFRLRRQGAVETGLDNPARMGAVQAGDGAAGDPLARLQAYAAPRGGFKQEARRAARAVGKSGRRPVPASTIPAFAGEQTGSSNLTWLPSMEFESEFGPAP
jgi:hypothetical protein